MALCVMAGTRIWRDLMLAALITMKMQHVAIKTSRQIKNVLVFFRDP